MFVPRVDTGSSGTAVAMNVAREMKRHEQLCSAYSSKEISDGNAMIEMEIAVALHGRRSLLHL